MSEENVEIVRGIYEAVVRRDGVAPFEVYSEDIVWDISNPPRAALNPNRVMAAIRDRGTGRTSGARVEARHFAVWTFADGKVTQLQVFDDRVEALEAAGLQE